MMSGKSKTKAKKIKKKYENSQAHEWSSSYQPNPTQPNTFSTFTHFRSRFLLKSKNHTSPSDSLCLLTSNHINILLFFFSSHLICGLSKCEYPFQCMPTMELSWNHKQQRDKEKKKSKKRTNENTKPINEMLEWMYFNCGITQSHCANNKLKGNY